MVTVRKALPEDAPELVRLRGVMLAAVAGADRAPDGSWEGPAEQTLRDRLAEPDGTMTAMVVDDPLRPGRLAACAVGVIEQRLGGPGNPSGLVGYVFSVATDPDHRRRGMSRACMEGLLGWFLERAINVVDLRASAEGEPLYRSLGFAHTGEPAMRLMLRRAPPPGSPQADCPAPD